MSDGKDRAGKDSAAADLEGLAKRFQDLWRDQMSASAADPEFMEMMGKWMGAFTAGAKPPGALPTAGMVPPGMPMDPAAWMAAMQAALAGGDRNEEGKPKAGSKAAAAASGAGDVAGDKLERRLAGLEARLERLEAALDGARGGPAKRPRRGKS
ncbi:MAG: hypothetical protein V3S44_05115 [Alphaproteobacteria bacterium]